MIDGALPTASSSSRNLLKAFVPPSPQSASIVIPRIPRRHYARSSSSVVSRDLTQSIRSVAVNSSKEQFRNAARGMLARNVMHQLLKSHLVTYPVPFTREELNRHRCDEFLKCPTSCEPFARSKTILINIPGHHDASSRSECRSRMRQPSQREPLRVAGVPFAHSHASNTPADAAR